MGIILTQSSVRGSERDPAAKNSEKQAKANPRGVHIMGTGTG